MADADRDGADRGAPSAAAGGTPGGRAPRPARGRVAALAALWLLLAIAIAARQPDRAEPERLPDRALPPVTIDLNRDPWPRLLLIEGIGESLAQRIVAVREGRGGFADLAEVQAIPGVPDEAIERARAWLRLGRREGGMPGEGDAAGSGGAGAIPAAAGTRSGS